MKNKSLIFAIILLVAGFALGQVFHLPEMVARWKPASKAGQTAKDTAGKILYWTCGMHPQIHEDKPGNCPICGMKLTPVRESSAASGDKKKGRGKILYWVAPMDPNYRSDKPGKSPMGMDLVPVYENDVAGGSTITIDPAMVQNMGVRTASVTRGPLERTIRAVGIVEYNERTLAVINSKVPGWIEKVYVQETGAYVEKGAPLYDIYAPELVSVQQEYLLSLESGSSRIRSAVRTRLRFWDIPEAEIERLARTREIRKTITINAPVSGYIVDRMAAEGSNVMMGADLFKIADLSDVWVIARIYENESQFVEEGQDADMTLSYLPGKSYSGRVDYVYPDLDPMTRDIKVRIVFPNKNKVFKPGMFANVKLKSRIAEDALLIPDEAVIRSGERNMVFVVRGQGQFQPRDVELGPSDSRGRVQVLTGLADKDVVVTSAQFLFDSESRLREAAAKITAPETHYGHDEDTNKQSKSKSPDESKAGDMKDKKKANAALWPDPSKGKFVCPMEDDNYYSDKPGKCPKCGMTLVDTQKLHDETHGPDAHQH